MSFRCQRCGTAFPNEQHPEEKRPKTVITNVRPRRYFKDYEGYAYGWEIAEEQKICTPCVTTYKPPVVEYSPEDFNEHNS